MLAEPVLAWAVLAWAVLEPGPARAFPVGAAVREFWSYSDTRCPDSETMSCHDRTAAVPAQEIALRLLGGAEAAGSGEDVARTAGRGVRRAAAPAGRSAGAGAHRRRSPGRARRRVRPAVRPPAAAARVRAGRGAARRLPRRVRVRRAAAPGHVLVAGPDRAAARGAHRRASGPDVRAGRADRPGRLAAPGHRPRPARPDPRRPGRGPRHRRHPGRRRPGPGRLPALGLAQGGPQARRAARHRPARRPPARPGRRGLGSGRRANPGSFAGGRKTVKARDPFGWVCARGELGEGTAGPSG